MGKKVQYLEEDKHQSEDQFCKSMQDMDCMKVDMRNLFSKVDVAENHDIGEMQNLASEIQIK